MDINTDYYQVLGVLPDAEQVVITAAYRALASRYHPDRWKGDVTESTNRMAELNVAYGVIGDRERRKEYDSQRSKTYGRFRDSDESTAQAFEEAMREFEDKWKIACDVFPDLVEIRKNLGRTSRKLAFAFVVQIIEQKQFSVRHELAEAMERCFLEQHFGSSQKIVEYARSLIQWGFKDAIKRLNEFVDVLGSNVESDAIVKRIEKEFKLEERRSEIRRAASAKVKTSKEIEKLRRSVIYQPMSEDAFLYARALGYELNIALGGFFRPDNYEIRSSEGGAILFETEKRGAMCLWIKNNLL